MFKSCWNLDKKIGAIDIILSQESVKQTDSTLSKRFFSRHVEKANAVIDATSRPTHRCHDVVIGLELSHRCPRGDDQSEALVTYNKKVESGRRGTVLAGIDLTIRTVDSYA
jgi:hypothetical protein